MVMEENDIVVNEIDMTSLEIDREAIKKKTTNAILVNIFVLAYVLITEIFNVSDELDSQFWNEYLYEYVTKEPSRKYASEVIKKLKDGGNEIYIVTARYLTDRNTEDGQRMRKIVIDWLEQENIVYDKIVFAPEDKLQICLENNIEITGSVFRKSSLELKRVIQVCREKGIELTGSVFLKDAEEVGKIADTCRKHGIPITGSVFRRDASEIDEIVEVCNELGIPVSGTVLLRDAEEIRKIHKVCNEYGIPISANVFKKSASEIEDIALVCKKYDIVVTATLFKKSASSLEKSLSYVRDNYGKSYMIPLVVVTDKTHLERVFPHLDEKGTLTSVIASPAILTLKFDEILERESLISSIGEDDVVNGRFNPIYGLSRKKYDEKKKNVKKKGAESK